MKVKTSILTTLLLLIFIIGSPVYFDMLTQKTEQGVLTYNALQEGAAEVQMKPVSRGDAMDRREQQIDLKLMTFNIHRGVGRNGRLSLNAVAEVLLEGKADIIALQEVERYSIRTAFQDQIKYLAERLDWNYAYGKSINILNGEFGNGLISRYPIEEYEVFELPSRGEQRTVLRAVINIDGYRLAVYNTHLGLNEEERQEQIDFILNMVAAESLEHLLMGDMNSSASKLSRVVDVMADSAEGSDKKDHSTFVDKDVQERIDYIFLSRKLIASDYDVIVTEASDHYAVLCKVQLN